MDQPSLYWGQYFEHEVKRIQLFITSLINKRLGKTEKIWCQLLCYGTLPSVIFINVLPCSAFPSFFSIIKPTLFHSTIMKQAFDSTSADIRVHDYGTRNPLLVRCNTWDQTRNWFRAKETLWNEFVKVGGVDRQSREVFFACLWWCIGQSPLKGITVTHRKSAIYLLWKRERGRNREGSYKSHLPVQNLSAPTNSALQRK